MQIAFALNVSVTVFVKCLDTILGTEILNFATVYVDDILIASTTFGDHCSQNGRVLNTLKYSDITVNLQSTTDV